MQLIRRTGISLSLSRQSGVRLLLIFMSQGHCGQPSVYYYTIVRDDRFIPNGQGYWSVLLLYCAQNTLILFSPLENSLDCVIDAEMATLNQLPVGKHILRYLDVKYILLFVLVKHEFLLSTNVTKHVSVHDNTKCGLFSGNSSLRQCGNSAQDWNEKIEFSAHIQCFWVLPLRFSLGVLIAQ